MHSRLGAATELLAPNFLPFYNDGVRVGFPSPADDYLGGNICLQDLLVLHPAATFLVKIEADELDAAAAELETAIAVREANG